MKPTVAPQDNQDRAPLVSVIIPTYNRCAYLHEAIASVLAQTYAPLELIVVDDGSSDDTPELLYRYRDRLKVIRQSNQGVSAARNRGIRAARGEWIALLDSDDVWQPEKLALQTAYLNAHPELKICQTQEIWIRNGRRVNPKKRHHKRAGDIFEPSLALCLVSPSAVMLRTSLLAEVGVFDEQLPACEDYDLWLRVSARYPVGLVDVPAVVKRGGHADQLSAMPELDKYRIRAITKLLDAGGLTTAQKSAAVKVLSEKCRIYAAGCCKRGRNMEAEYYASLPDQYL